MKKMIFCNYDEVDWNIYNELDVYHKASGKICHFYSILLVLFNQFTTAVILDVTVFSYSLYIFCNLYGTIFVMKDYIYIKMFLKTCSLRLSFIIWEFISESKIFYFMRKSTELSCHLISCILFDFLILVAAVPAIFFLHP